MTLGNYDLAEGTATLKLVVNPMVDWIWFGFMLLAIGDRHRAVARAVLERMTVGRRRGCRGAARRARRAGAAAGAGRRGPRCCWRRRPAAAQMEGGTPRRPNPVGPDENWLVHNIICQCGTCRHNLIDCATENCGHAIQTG